MKPGRINCLGMVLCFALLVPSAWAVDKGLARPVSEHRVALVIGNKDYADKPLKNPLNDARDMKTALESLGFKVVYRENADLAQMDEAMREFARSLDKDSVALFYYSGHGLQVDGINYLVPIGVSIASKSEVKSRAYDANIVLGDIEESKARVGLVVLDACRDSPLRGFRSSSSGLAQMGGSGPIIAFATAPGQTAEDGKGRNGTFTKHLLAHLQEPGLTAIAVLQQVQTEVADETGNSQKPWINFGPQHEAFCFAGCKSADNTEETYWISIKDSNDPADFQAYLKQYGNGGVYAALANNRLKRLPPVGAGSKPALVGSKLTPEVSKPVALAGLEPAPTDLDSPRPNHFRDCPACPEMVRLPAGEFMMGAAPGEAEAGSDEQPRHRVKIKAFSIGQYEVTQGQWQAVMGSNPSNFKQCGDNCPVETVSFDDIQMFIEKLNAKTGKAYRLPTEAEWEYAARAGTSTPFSTGDCINTRQANYDGNYDYNHCGAKTGVYLQKTAPVGSYPANPWGLYDMHGNVWEWTCSAYTDQYDGNDRICTNSANDRRAVRGGSWDIEPRALRSAVRNGDVPTKRGVYYGFRLAQD